MVPFDYDTLTPGIRKVVAWLHEHDFITVDSGDGVTNIEAGIADAMSIPNVSMTVTDTEHLVEEATRLHELLKRAGVMIYRMGIDDNKPCIVAQFDPADDTAIITLLGVDDKMLIEALAKKKKKARD
jgi:hypothetical protein